MLLECAVNVLLLNVMKGFAAVKTCMGRGLDIAFLQTRAGEEEAGFVHDGGDMMLNCHNVCAHKDHHDMGIERSRMTCMGPSAPAGASSWGQSTTLAVSCLAPLKSMHG